MIIATAGHVDHGKTSLVRHLTGVETDTLAEERKRGLSINLGYAYLPRPQGIPLGFIDVPGHQRFINTMISGISGIDMGLLVVAADDGPMPQTIEHLDVLDILGVEQLTAVISKTDRASDARISEVTLQTRDLLAARRWQDATFFQVCNQDGNGVDVLQHYLIQHAEQLRQQRNGGGFRLSIDRCFTARGSGLVVTGTASAGTVRKGDKLLLLPAALEVRVRGLRAHNQDADTAEAGQRVALNLSGKLDKSAIERGDWLVDPACALSSSRLDVAFSLLPGAPFPLKHLSPAKLYIGASRVAARLAIIDGAEARLHPGNHCLAQLILEKPVSAILGERFLLRDQAENVILGGGKVLDPQGLKYGKSRPDRLIWLHAMQLPTANASLASLIAQQQLVDLDHFWAIRNQPGIPGGADLPCDARSFESEGRHWAVAQALWAQAAEQCRQLVDSWHQTHPASPGIRMSKLKPALAEALPSPLAMAVLVSLLQTGELHFRDGHISRKGFQPIKSGEAQAHWQELRQHLERCHCHIPLYSELIEATRIPETALRQVVKAATASGELHRLNDNRYALPHQLLHFSQRVMQAADEGEALSVVALKSRFGSGRKLTIELLEYFDSIHFTRRQGDRRIVANRDVAFERFGA
ncbi:MAG: selenocysteine-specific translation elongation factor [Gammaproteobacteria bacterium]|nr:selenocysteine-specific translation elongation factor [Gammaproteobacteria bacterium]